MSLRKVEALLGVMAEKELEKTKNIAIQFVMAIHTCNADQPLTYIENAKPFMTEDLQQIMDLNGRRELLERFI